MFTAIGCTRFFCSSSTGALASTSWHSGMFMAMSNRLHVTPLRLVRFDGLLDVAYCH